MNYVTRHARRGGRTRAATFARAREGWGVLALIALCFFLNCLQDVGIDSGMARKKSSAIAASSAPGGAAVAGVELDAKELKKRFRSFKARCKDAKNGVAPKPEDEPRWKPASAETRKKYGHPGRPTKFQSLEELYEAVLAYFEDCDARTKTVIINSRERGEELKEMPDPAPKDVSNLCIFIGIARNTWYRYRDESHPFAAVCAWFDLVEVASWYKLLEDPKRAKAAQFVLAAKHGFVVKSDITSDGKPIGSPLGQLLAEIDGQGFVLPEGADEW